MFEIFFAVLAGMLTIAAPCILPLLPILLGVSFGQKNKFRPLFIVAGFIIVFSLAATGLSLLAKATGFDTNIIRNIGIVVLAIFGILLIWPTPFELLAIKLTPILGKVSQKAGLGNKGNFSALFLGMALGLVWTPCAGPVLASILTLIALQKEILSAGILILAYALGAGIPMLIIAYAGQKISTQIEFLSKHSKLLQQIFGVLILLTALAMYFNYDTKIYAEILKYYPSLNPTF